MAKGDAAVNENQTESEKEKLDKTSWSEFLEGTTLHGARYTVDGSSRLRRAVWLICLIVMATGLVIFVTKALLKYSTYPTRTTVSIKHTDKMEFPAVTICNVNTVRSSVIHTMPLEYEALYALSGLHFIPATINFYDPLVWNALTKTNISQIIEATKHTLSMLSICYWENIQIPCKDVFVPSSMIDTNCFTFNSESAIAARGSPLNNTRSGEAGGLKVIVDVQSWDYSVILASTTAVGIKVAVHDPNTYPDIYKTFLVSPGMQTKVALHKTETTGLPAPYQSSWCEHSADKVSLAGHKHYSYAACMEQCYNDIMYEMCGCVTSTYKGIEPACDLGTYAACSIHASIQFYNNATLVTQCGCYHPCQETTYSYSISAQNYPAQHLKEQFEYLIPGTDFKYFGGNVLELVIYFEQFSWTEVTQVAAYTLDAFAADLGGQMGLFLGASILTVVEFVDFICFLGLHCCKRKPKNAANTIHVQSSTHT